VPPGDPDASYDYRARLAANPALAGRLQAVANTGNIQRPLITLHGDQDSLLPIATDSDLYAQMVAQARKSRSHRYYVVQGGNHVDPLYDDHAGRDAYGDTVLRPMLPCVRAAIDALAIWVEGGVEPPPSHTIPRPRGATPADLANACSLR
jgi:predicted dienelactone hydrolase